MGNQAQSPLQELPKFEDVSFELLAELDYTKHVGGQQATEELIELCHINKDTYVLDVGCGVGMTPCYIAKEHGCRVVGVDLRDAMIARSKERAKRKGVEDRVEFRVADALDLPFDEALFDVVLCESVVAFVRDKQKAVGEFVRVTKPEGYVGLSESTWVKEPSPELLGYLSRTFGRGLEVLPPEGWEGLLKSAGLRDIVVRTDEITVRSETRNRLRRIGGVRGLVRILYRMLLLLIKRPAYRSFMKEAFSSPELIGDWGYGLYVGKR